MSYDLFAAIKVTNDAEIEAVRNGQSNGLSINDIYTRSKLLSGGLTYKDTEVKAAHKKIVHECKLYNTLITSELERMAVLRIKTPQIEINNLPPFSVFLQFTLKLAKPYLSKDDDVFYPCENPVRKDKVFKVPMVSASTWKGNMRWTARQNNKLNSDKHDIPEIIRLFGNEKEEDYMKGFRRGRLNFYPTFFNQMSLEVINPHDRKTKAGTNPIYIESVPEGASGTFSMLYVPFDLMGKQESEVKEQVKKDMSIVYDSLKEMMLTYGFSAKKGNGFGVVDKNITGTFEMSRCHVDKRQSDSKVDKSNPFSKLSVLAKPKNETEFSGFDGLKKLMDRVKEVMERGHDI